MGESVNGRISEWENQRMTINKQPIHHSLIHSFTHSPFTHSPIHHSLIRTLYLTVQQSECSRVAKRVTDVSCETMMMVRPSSRLRRASRVQHFLARVGVQIAGWLIGQDDAGIVSQRTRDGDALLLPARKLGGPVRHTILQSHALQECRSPARGAPPGRCD
jgi:hypothetical protein